MVELIQVAARLAGCTVDRVLAYGVRVDGALVVVVSPGPKYIFGEEYWRLIEDSMNKGEEAAVSEWLVRARMIEPAESMAVADEVTEEVPFPKPRRKRGK